MSYRAVVDRFLCEDSSGKIRNEESLVDLGKYEVEKSILHVDPFRIWIVLWCCFGFAGGVIQEKVPKLPLSTRKYL